MENKKSQVTIFVIIGLIIVALIILIFVLRNRAVINLGAAENPQNYIQQCIGEELAKVDNSLLGANGYPNMANNYIEYRNEKVKYLCKASQFYAPCINQEPMLIEYWRKQIEKNMKTKTDTCFASLSSNLQRNGYEIRNSNTTFEIEFTSSAIIENINTNFVMTKGEEVRSFNKFVVKIETPTYALIDVTRNIINYESTLCQFNSIGWMMQFRDIGVDRFSTSDQTKVYRVYDKLTGKDLTFAIKTCVLPAGI